MSNLLDQHWFIARRMPLFWLMIVFFAAGGMFSTLEYGPGFSIIGGVGFALAPVTAFFIGEEGSSGRLDSEIISGFPRTQIWLSNLLTVLFLGLLLMTAAIAGEFAASALKYSLNVYSLPGFGIFLVGAILNTGAYAAIYTLVVMFLAARRSGRSVAALIVCICIFLVFLIWGPILSDRLSEPEYYVYYGYGDGSSDVIAYGTEAGIDREALDAYIRETGHHPAEGMQIYREANPAYVGEPLRTQYTQIVQVIPLSQVYLLAETAVTEQSAGPDLYRAASTMWLDAGIILAGCTAAGILLFRRRNLD